MYCQHLSTQARQKSSPPLRHNGNTMLATTAQSHHSKCTSKLWLHVFSQWKPSRVPKLLFLLSTLHNLRSPSFLVCACDQKLHFFWCPRNKGKTQSGEVQPKYSSQQQQPCDASPVLWHQRILQPSFLSVSVFFRKMGIHSHFVRASERVVSWNLTNEQHTTSLNSPHNIQVMIKPRIIPLQKTPPHFMDISVRRTHRPALSAETSSGKDPHTKCATLLVRFVTKIFCSISANATFQCASCYACTRCYLKCTTEAASWFFPRNLQDVNTRYVPDKIRELTLFARDKGFSAAVSNIVSLT